MLELRPNCELCDKDLPPESNEARICSYECTYCAACAEGVLEDVCINCGGGLTPRPIRPLREWRTGLSRLRQPPSAKRVVTTVSSDDIAAHVARVKDTPPLAR
jgi:hypothetical protein